MIYISLTDRGKEYAEEVGDDLTEGMHFRGISALESKILRYLAWRWNIDGKGDVPRQEILLYLNKISGGGSDLEYLDKRVDKGIDGLVDKKIIEIKDYLSMDFNDDYVPEMKTI